MSGVKTVTIPDFSGNVKIYLIAWLGLVVLAIINGVLRNNVYGPTMSELQAHQISSITAIILFGAATWLLHQRWPIQSDSQSWTIGITWLLMTVIFEFLFGHYVMGHSWSHLLADYNLLAGRVWSLVLLWTIISPYVIYTYS